MTKKFTVNGDPIPMTVAHLKKILADQIDGRPVVFQIPGFGDVAVVGAYVEGGRAALTLITVDHGEGRLSVYDEKGVVN